MAKETPQLHSKEVIKYPIPLLVNPQLDRFK